MTGFYNVLDYLAGDALKPDGSWNPQRTNDAPALDALLRAHPRGVFFFPAERDGKKVGYYLADWPENPASGKAILAVQTSATLLGGAAQDGLAGAPVYLDAGGQTIDGVLREPTTADLHAYSEMRDLAFLPAPGGTPVRYGVVDHALGSVTEHCSVQGATAWGHIRESGWSQNMQAATLLPQGTYINADMAVVRRCVAYFCGETPLVDGENGPVPGPKPGPNDTLGGGFYAHGPDSRTSYEDCWAKNCCAGWCDATQIGLDLVRCYSADCRVPLIPLSSGRTRVRDCFTEDYYTPSEGGQFGWFVSDGGSLRSSQFHRGAQDSTSFIANAGALQIQTPQSDAAWALYRNGGTTREDSYVDEPSSLQARSMGLRGRYVGGAGDDAGRAAYGHTRRDHPRGPWLFRVDAPQLGTRMSWAWRQEGVTVPPGVLVVQWAPTYARAFGFARADLSLPTQSIVSAAVEMHTGNSPNVVLPAQQGDAQIVARAAALAACPVEVGPLACLYQDAVRGVWGVRLANPTQAPVIVDVVWSFRIVRTSVDGGP